MKKIESHIVFDHDGTLVDTTKPRRELFSGLRELIEELHGEGVKLYVWTARGRASTVEILKSLDIIGRFEDLSCGTDSVQKPSPEGLYNMLGDISPKNVIVIGDSVGDMIGGSKYGATCIGALWAHGKEEASQLLTEYGANFNALTVKDLKQILKNIIE